MIVVSKTFKAKDKLKKIKKRFYSLIENKLYVKKDPTNLLKIRSPSQELSLFCNSQIVKETIHLTDGIPIENIKIILNDPLGYIVENNLDISISVKLQCVRCNHKRFRVSSCCRLVLDFVCTCGSKEWMVTSLVTEPAYLPIWYEGRKVSSSLVEYVPGGEFRVVGCNICWRLGDCEVMACGCLRCRECRWEHPKS